MNAPIIAALEVTRYASDGGDPRNEQASLPSWEQAKDELATMHGFNKPIVTLLREADTHDANLMMITGGEDVYHVQVATNEGDWREACDPEGGDEEIEVWTSDQGFTCPQCYTHTRDAMLRIAKHYFETGEMDAATQWK